MTIMQSCDHHDEAGCVPDNRSRKRMLEQFAAAHALGMAVQQLPVFGMTVNLFDSGRQPIDTPTVSVDLRQFLDLWLALRNWRDHEPRGDDLTPPVDPPSTTRVPDGDLATNQPPTEPG